MPFVVGPLLLLRTQLFQGEMPERGDEMTTYDAFIIVEGQRSYLGPLILLQPGLELLADAELAACDEGA